jgi:hypothetical protein
MAVVSDELKNLIKMKLPRRTKKVGMFKQRIKVSNSQNSELFFEEDFWVDTGALYSFVPENLLEQIKVEPVDKRSLVLADGRVVDRLFGFCSFEIQGFKGPIPCPIIFASKDSVVNSLNYLYLN